MATLIIEKLRELGLPLDRLVGACFDGAAAMASLKVGVAKHLRDVAPMAQYFHCAVHSVNLVCNLLEKKVLFIWLVWFIDILASPPI